MRASTDYAVLGMLTLQPMSGYDIRATIAESIAYFWTESYGQIYPTLNRLARERLVSKRGERAASRTRHVYAITDAGRAVLAEWLRQPAEERVPRNELLFKLFFSRHASPAAATRQVEAYRAAQAEARDRFATLDRELVARHAKNPDLPYWLITLRYGQLEAEARLRWADEALEILQELQALGLPERPAAPAEAEHR
jgi:DNA-binding PadR family transcriptional regulator